MGWRDATLTIASGETKPGKLNLGENRARRPANIMFFAPTTLPETITVYVAPDADADDGSTGARTSSFLFKVAAATSRCPRPKRRCLRPLLRAVCS